MPKGGEDNSMVVKVEKELREYKKTESEDMTGVSARTFRGVHTITMDSFILSGYVAIHPCTGGNGIGNK